MTETNKERHREPLRSIPTALISLSPQLLSQLKQIAPKKKRSKLFYFALFAIPAVVTFIAVYRPTRTFVVAKVRSAIRSEPPAAATSTSTSTATSTATTTPATTEPVASIAPPAPVASVANVVPSASAAVSSAAPSAVPSASASINVVKRKPVRRK